MAKFINTGTQNMVNMEDAVRQCFVLKEGMKGKSLTPNKHFAGVSTKVWDHLFMYTEFRRKYAIDYCNFSFTVSINGLN